MLMAVTRESAMPTQVIHLEGRFSMSIASFSGPGVLDATWSHILSIEVHCVNVGGARNFTLGRAHSSLKAIGTRVLRSCIVTSRRYQALITAAGWMMGKRGTERSSSWF